MGTPHSKLWSGLSAVALTLVATLAVADPRGSGDLGVIIERGAGRVQVVETSHNSILGQVEGLGDLSHASVVFSRDERFAFVFGRDGGLTKVDLLERKIAARVVQAGNSIGGAISQSGRLVAVANYEPGGVKVFDVDSLELLAEIPAEDEAGKRSKVIGLEDGTGERFVFSLWDAGQTWIADLRDPRQPKLTKFTNTGRNPYDALITTDGRFYLAGLYGEDGLALIDLWHPEAGLKRILSDYGPGDTKLPVYKMPHLEGWAVAGNRAFIPGVGRHEVLVIDTQSWQQVGHIPVEGQPVFVMARPDGRQIWVNFALPENDRIQVIDAESLQVIHKLKPGKGVLHLEFEPRGEEVWVSVRDEDKVLVYDTETFELKASLPAEKPSGIFFTARAHRIGF